MKLDNHIGFLLTKTLRQLNCVFNSEFSHYGITSEQWSLLKRLTEQEGSSIKDLAQAVEKDQANVTRIVDVLEKRGLVKRSANPDDKRSTLIYFTNEGKELTASLAPTDEKVHQIAVDGLTEQEIAQFSQVLAKIHQNAHQYLNIAKNKESN
ncbi:MarR family transcriptional regulator [Paenibacillus cellulosilyticus]|uniref:MarR family transcriptional regulator n=1 Tax=Paenibacillus cellulosilyticus TaxID=375489 RepID=A0A2V2YZ11_9BACL|nr:MarR family transcriptional regulator [Paenibacillus cellulosilyticus]PWW07172.1 MarR family transcriptional regulator [Paenibacillus cellulosilyticus]QKS44624.1 MarR family transcriptional regulator [Paenibacillus cellulosilyticus]